MAAFANRGELRASVKTWLSESQITDATINIAIALAEARINRTLRLLDGEANTDITISSGTTAVPSGFRGVVRFNLSTSPITPLTEMKADQLSDYLRDCPSGKPLFYSLEGNGDLLPVFRWAPSPDTTYTAPLTYTKTWQLVEDDDSNTILEDCPDLYLYGALVHGRLKLQEPQRLPDVKGLFDEALAEAKIDDLKTRRGRGRTFRQSRYRTTRGWNAA